MNLFRVRGIQLAVHFSFLLLLAYVGWEGWQGDPAQHLPPGWHGMIWNLVTITLCFTCVVLHELGHSFTAMHFGIGVRRILLMPIGGMAEFDAIPREPRREFLITIAGPAVNFVIAGVLFILFGVPQSWPFGASIAYNAHGMAQVILTWNLVMGCFNLLPAFPMDGGRIFRALLASRLPYLRATFIAATLGKVIALTLAAVFLWLNLWQPAVLFTFIFVVGELEYRAVKRREVEEAHLRATYERMYAQAAAITPIETPPPLQS